MRMTQSPRRTSPSAEIASTVTPFADSLKKSLSTPEIRANGSLQKLPSGARAAKPGPYNLFLPAL
jgi:hypothetical protein